MFRRVSLTAPSIRTLKYQFAVKENFNSIRFLFRKSEIYDFFRLAKTGNDVELFVKARWCNANYRIIGDKLYVPNYLKARLCVCGVYVYKNKRGNTNNQRLEQSALAAACIFQLYHVGVHVMHSRVAKLTNNIE